MIDLKSMLKKAWHDPVGSQVIGWMIIVILGVLGVVFSSVSHEIKEFFLTSIPLGVVIILIAITYTLSRILDYYSKKNRIKRIQIEQEEKEKEKRKLAIIENQKNRNHYIWKIFNGLNYANLGTISKLIKTGDIDTQNEYSYYINQSKYYDYIDSILLLDHHIQLVPACVKHEQIGENIYFNFDPYVLKLFKHYIKTGIKREI